MQRSLKLKRIGDAVAVDPMLEKLLHEIDRELGLPERS